MDVDASSSEDERRHKKGATQQAIRDAEEAEADAENDAAAQAEPDAPKRSAALSPFSCY